MHAVSYGLGMAGLEAQLIHVEVATGRGPTAFHLVGLPEASVREARVRVRAALLTVGFDIDQFVLTVSLTPADVRKTGSALDLAIAVSVFAALARPADPELESTVWMGELSLTGAIRPVRGVLPAVISARKLGFSRVVVPSGNQAEAAVVEGISVLSATSFEAVVAQLAKRAELPRATRAPLPPSPPEALDLSDVRGQVLARRALEVAAAGGHNLLLLGPPGAGKTMLARRIPSILPALSFEEATEVTSVHSIAGLLPCGAGLVSVRPFRAPHHTASAAALTGGGIPIKPGEIALAHHGCLFLDEVIEFSRPALESLRQPLEDGQVTVSRVRERATFPTRPLVVAAANPCPCGHAPGPKCRCSRDRVERYRGRLSGPLLDRLDLHVFLPRSEARELSDATRAESSGDVRIRVLDARRRQRLRAEALGLAGETNGALTDADLRRAVTLRREAEAILARAVDELGFSARARGKMIRVARTLADLESSDEVGAAHVAEALQYRRLDRSLVTSRGAGAIS